VDKPQFSLTRENLAKHIGLMLTASRFQVCFHSHSCQNDINSSLVKWRSTCSLHSVFLSQFSSLECFPLLSHHFP